MQQRFWTSVRVVHGDVGCDTGCCGHQIIATNVRGEEHVWPVRFEHPYEVPPNEIEAWARSFVAPDWPPHLLDFAASDIVPEH